jgi:thiamine biosynthesis lipoprotein
MRRRTEQTPDASIKRSRPLLGTYVAIAVAGLSEADAVRAIERGFAAIADIHRLMSFHEADSDVSRVNRAAAGETIAVDPRTFTVLQQAADLAADSGGIFDITVAAELVAWGFLPVPGAARAPDPNATYQDIELIPSGHVRLARPLWVDLGGIAKGYAVDRALQAMGLPSNIQCSVNAGGDLRVSGPDAERVLLRAPADGDAVPVLEIENASVASSSGRDRLRQVSGRDVGPHLDGASRHGVGTQDFVSVVAEDCMVADALTKIVLTEGSRADDILKRHDATAYLLKDGMGWQTIGVTN